MSLKVGNGREGENGAFDALGFTSGSEQFVRNTPKSRETCDNGHMRFSTSPARRHRTAAGLAAGALLLAACGGSVETAVVDAGEPINVVAGEAPVFDACSSSGDIVNYQWQIVGTPTANAEDEGKFLRTETEGCSFTLENVMEIDEVGLWTVELSVEVSDGTILTDTVDVTVTDS